MLKDNFLNVHDVFLMLTIIEIPFLCALFKLMPSKVERWKPILIAFFLLIAGTLVATLITWNSYLQQQPIAEWDVVPLFLSCFILLQGPALYLYMRSLSAAEELLVWKNIIHLVPAASVCLVIGWFSINVSGWQPENWPEMASAERAAVKFVLAVVKCSPVIYVIACLREMIRLRKLFGEDVLPISVIELRFSQLVLVGFTVQWLWSFVMYFLSDYMSHELNDLFGILNNYLLVIFVNVVFFFGIFYARRLHDVPEQPAAKIPEAPQLDEKILAVHRGIEKKLFLESQINLERFAEQVGLKPREVSAVLSSHYHSNFFEFINGYRVEEAKRLLLAPECERDSIQEIIFKSGFNSQSAFHRFFKRIVGQTPSQFRNQRASLT